MSTEGVPHPEVDAGPFAHGLELDSAPWLGGELSRLVWLHGSLAAQRLGFIGEHPCRESQEELLTFCDPAPKPPTSLLHMPEVSC